LADFQLPEMRPVPSSARSGRYNLIHYAAFRRVAQASGGPLSAGPVYLRRFPCGAYWPVADRFPNSSPFQSHARNQEAVFSCL